MQNRFDSVVQAIIASMQQQAENKRIGIEQERTQAEGQSRIAEQALREKQFTQLQKSEEFQHGIQSQQLQNEHDRLQAELKDRQLNYIQGMKILHDAGVNVDSLINGQWQQPQQQSSQQSQSLPQQPQQGLQESDFPSPQDALQIEANRIRTLAQAKSAGDISGQQLGEATAPAPGMLSKRDYDAQVATTAFNRQQQLNQAGYSNAASIAQANREAENKRNADTIAGENGRTKLDTDTQKYISTMNKYASLQLAGLAPISGTGFSGAAGGAPSGGAAPGTASANPNTFTKPNGENPLLQQAIGQIATGQRKPINSALDKAATSAITAMGGRIDVSDVGQDLTGLEHLRSGYKNMEDWVNNESPTGFIGKIYKGVVENNQYSDSRKDYDTVMADFLKNAQELGGASKGRVPAAQFSLEMGGAPSFTGDKKTNLKTIKDGRTRIDAAEADRIQGLPDWQTSMIKNVYGLKIPPADVTPNTPDFLKMAPQKTASGRTLDVQQSIQEGRPVYK